MSLKKARRPQDAVPHPKGARTGATGTLNVFYMEAGARTFHPSHARFYGDIPVMPVVGTADVFIIGALTYEELGGMRKRPERLMPGVCVLVQPDRTRSVRRFLTQSNNPLGVVKAQFVAVYEDGLLDLLRGMERIEAKLGVRDIKNITVAIELLSMHIKWLSRFHGRDKEEVKQHEIQLTAAMERLETSGEGWKAKAIKELLEALDPKDVLGRVNVSRIPLMIEHATRCAMVALEETMGKLSAANARALCVRQLVTSVIAEGESAHIIVHKDLGSPRLWDEDVTENKDICVMQWRDYAQALRTRPYRPFLGSFMDAADCLEQAADEFEKSDGSGMEHAKRLLREAEAHLSVPRLLYLLNSVLSPIAGVHGGVSEISTLSDDFRRVLSQTLEFVAEALISLDVTLANHFSHANIIMAMNDVGLACEAADEELNMNTVSALYTNLTQALSLLSR